MPSELSRRQVLRLLSFLSAGTAAVGSVPFISKFFASKAIAQTVYTRENIATFAQSPTKIAALRNGIRVMQSRPATDPTSWTYQANIHGTTVRPLRTAWNTCSHGSFFFLSWHRMYVYYFERILRAASGDPSLALPYWDSFTQLFLPEPFRIPADPATNPLYVTQRASAINSGTEGLEPSDVSYAAAFRLTNFFHTTTTGRSFGGRRVSQTLHTTSDNRTKGQLERVPHDQVHVVVGGNGGLMSNVNNAARDPIFWLHHANIDRLWESWLANAGGTNPTNDGDWMNDPFTFFNENRTRVTLRGRDIINTVQQLGYRYENLSSLVGANASAVQRTDGNTQPQEVAMTASNQELSIVLTDAPLTLTAPTQDLVGARALTAESALILNVEGVEYNPENSIPYKIYINLPQGATPEFNSPYYAGRLALFALRQRGTFTLDITDVVRGLQERNLMTGDSISVTFVPPPGEIPQTIVSQGSPTQLQGAVRFNRVTITRQ